MSGRWNRHCDKRDFPLVVSAGPGIDPAHGGDRDDGADLAGAALATPPYHAKGTQYAYATPCLAAAFTGYGHCRGGGARHECTELCGSGTAGIAGWYFRLFPVSCPVRGRW